MDKEHQCILLHKHIIHRGFNMKNMRIFKKKDGGYLDALKDTRPELYNTINTYRTRIGKLDEGDEKVTKFDNEAAEHNTM